MFKFDLTPMHHLKYCTLITFFVCVCVGGGGYLTKFFLGGGINLGGGRVYANCGC